jgi:hypothetical protein
LNLFDEMELLDEEDKDDKLVELVFFLGSFMSDNDDGKVLDDSVSSSLS